MSYNPSKILVCTALMAIVSIGCTPSKPIYRNDAGDLSSYIEQATKIEYADVEYATLDEVTQSLPPITVLDPDFGNYEDVTLESCVSFALSNTKVIRGYGTPGLQGTRVSPGVDDIANGPAAAATSYNVAIRETEPGFIGTPGQIANPSSITTNTALDGNQGVEAALADFDAQLTSSFSYTKTDEPRNNNFNQFNAQTFLQDQLQWQTEVAKKSANGTQIFFRNVNQYVSNNIPLTSDPIQGLQVLDSFYRASFEAEIRQPLLRGRGAFINRMPIVISRISTDQEIANLEATLQNMVTNVEIRYWDLYCAYRSFDAATTGRDAAAETWRIVKDQYDEGAEVNIQQLAQASGQYNFFQEQVIDSYNNVLDAENSLRFLLGWSHTDGKLLRPVDEPVMAPIEFDWCTSLCEALTYRPEIRQERWEVKKRELAVHYSKNGLLPELNVSLLYRWLGLGNRYGTSDDSQPFPSAQSGALNELYGGDHQEIALTGSFGMPIGFRRELANVRNAQLKLAREVARAEDMELDISNQLAEAIRALAANQRKMVFSFNQWIDTSTEEDHFERLKDAGVETLDVALDAQRRRSQAAISFYTSLCEYNKVIALIHRRKGTILPYSGVHFSEGPWPGKAYIDAQEHARRRGASRQINYGWTRPGVISRGENWPTNQNSGQPISATTLPAPQTPIVDTYGIAPVDPYGGVPMQDGIILDGPIEAPYQAPTDIMPETINSGDLQIPMIPTPALETTRPAGASLQRQNRQATTQTVRQVGYEEDVPSVDSEPIDGKFRPVAILKPEFRKKRLQAPSRDTSPPPAKRLRAVPQLRPDVQPRNSQQGTGVLRSDNLSWEKLGLRKPESGRNTTTARIKMN